MLVLGGMMVLMVTVRLVVSPSQDMLDVGVDPRLSMKG